jgi:hypothetical protein
MNLVLDISSLLEFVREYVRLHKPVIILRRQVSATHTNELRTSLVDSSSLVNRYLVCCLLRFHSKFGVIVNKIIKGSKLI